MEFEQALIDDLLKYCGHALKPGDAASHDAVQRLVSVGLVGADGSLTDLGREVAAQNGVLMQQVVLATVKHLVTVRLPIKGKLDKRGRQDTRPYYVTPGSLGVVVWAERIGRDEYLSLILGGPLHQNAAQLGPLLVAGKSVDRQEVLWPRAWYLKWLGGSAE